MVDTGVKYPTTKTTQSVLPEDDNDWTSPANIGADDAAYASITAATFDSPDKSYRLKAQGFDFSVIPLGAQITGILVEIERFCDAGETGKDYRVQLLDGNGNLVGDNKAAAGNWETTPTIKSYGGIGDTWNAYLHSGDVKSALFGVVLSVSATTANADIYVDYIRILIYYSPPQSVALVSVGQSPGANSTYCVIVKPVGLEVGHLMVAQVVGVRSTALSSTFTAPANWTEIRQDTGGEDPAWIRTALFWKIAAADDVAAIDFTFRPLLAYSNRGTIGAWTGHNPTTPINANNGQFNAASTTVTSPTITPTVANCMICLFCGIFDNNTQSGYAIVTSNPASWAEAYDLPSDLTYDLGLSLGYALRPETSATGNGTATTSGSDRNIGQLVAIAPAAAVTETIVAKEFPMGYYQTTGVKELRSKVSGATITEVAKNFPHILQKAGKAKELVSKWS